MATAWQRDVPDQPVAKSVDRRPPGFFTPIPQVAALIVDEASHQGREAGKLDGWTLAETAPIIESIEFQPRVRGDHEPSGRVVMHQVPRVSTAMNTNTNARVIAVAAAVLLVAVVGCQSQPGNGDVSGQATIAPSPSRTPLASGTFRFPPMGTAVVLDVTGERPPT